MAGLLTCTCRGESKGQMAIDRCRLRKHCFLAAGRQWAGRVGQDYRSPETFPDHQCLLTSFLHLQSCAAVQWSRRVCSLLSAFFLQLCIINQIFIFGSGYLHHLYKGRIWILSNQPGFIMPPQNSFSMQKCLEILPSSSRYIQYRYNLFHRA